MKRLLGAVGLWVGFGVLVPAALAQPQPASAPGVLARNPAELKELLNRKAPPMPHEAQPDRWPRLLRGDGHAADRGPRP